MKKRTQTKRLTTRGVEVTGEFMQGVKLMSKLIFRKLLREQQEAQHAKHEQEKKNAQ